jgi:hypothetical protein
LLLENGSVDFFFFLASSAPLKFRRDSETRSEKREEKKRTFRKDARENGTENASTSARKVGKTSLIRFVLSEEDEKYFFCVSEIVDSARVKRVRSVGWVPQETRPDLVKVAGRQRGERVLRISENKKSIE